MVAVLPSTLACLRESQDSDIISATLEARKWGHMSDSRNNGTVWIVLSIVFGALVIGGALLWVNRASLTKSEPTVAAKKTTVVVATSTPMPAPTASANASSAPRIIERSDRVAGLQRALAKIGLFSGAIDGVYGPATMDAVKKLQVKVGVTPDGIFGPKTWAAASQAGLLGKGTVVMNLQVALTTLGYYSGPVDGKYTAETEKAIKAFQTDQKMAADGLWSPALDSALQQALTNE
jgi:peptidoglycan hydrolase-like protein with peptidoglycan-binding domain